MAFIQQGNFPVWAGTTEADVSFGVPFQDEPAAVVASLGWISEDAVPAKSEVTVTSADTLGFHVEFSPAIVGDEWRLMWSAGGLEAVYTALGGPGRRVGDLPEVDDPEEDAAMLPVLDGRWSPPRMRLLSLANLRRAVAGDDGTNVRHAVSGAYVQEPGGGDPAPGRRAMARSPENARALYEAQCWQPGVWSFSPVLADPNEMTLPYEHVAPARAGSAAIPEGASEISVSFEPELPSGLRPWVRAGVFNQIDAAPEVPAVLIRSESASGFTAALAFPSGGGAPSPNYVLRYTADGGHRHLH